jgi:hypothetical protein
MATGFKPTVVASPQDFPNHPMIDESQGWKKQPSFHVPGWYSKNVRDTIHKPPDTVVIIMADRLDAAGVDCR